MRISISKAIFYLLLLIPISFKIEIREGIAFFPQELLLPILLILLLIQGINKIPMVSYPYVFYALSLFVVLLSTIFSQFGAIDPGGLLKTLKYLFYVLTFLILPFYHFEGFVQKFNRVAFLSITVTLCIYFFQMVTFSGSLSEFISLSIWDVNYVASGLSNINFSLSELSFVRSTGNHGIYGSFLVLIYMVNISQVIDNKNNSKLAKILIVLSIFNLLLLNSRETLLLFILANSPFIIRPILNLKIKRSFMYLSMALVLVLIILVANGVSIGLIEKVSYTIESLTTTGGENNMSLRFAVWHLMMKSFLLFPLFFFIGYGYNSTRFEQYMETTNQHFHLYKTYATVPENIFFMFLSYGGVFALALFLLFYLSTVYETFKVRNQSIVAAMFFPFVLGLFITNNTGGSLLSDLFLTQFALIYTWIIKQHGGYQNTLYNSQG